MCDERARFTLKKMMEMRLQRRRLQAWALQALRQSWQQRRMIALQAQHQLRRCKYIIASWRSYVVCVQVSCLFVACDANLDAAVAAASRKLADSLVFVVTGGGTTP